MGRADRLILRQRFRARTRTRARLGAAIRLGLVQVIGTRLGTLNYVPRSALAHVRPIAVQFSRAAVIFTAVVTLSSAARTFAIQVSPAERGML